MQEAANVVTDGVAVQPKQQAMIEIESQRSIQEVQASMTVAKRFPRDTLEVYTRIVEACKRPSFADQAMYAYQRGGNLITGESIRLAELLIREWGNSVFGIRELRQDAEEGYSDVEAFAWDLQTNTKQVKTFTVPHIRYSKAKGNVRLTDPRDIYEMVANQGSRRMRACILGLIPIDMREAAINHCEMTLENNIEGNKEDFVRRLVVDFKEIDVTREMMEKLVGCKLDEATRKDIANLVKIQKSIKDGITKRQDFFETPGSEVTEAAEDLAKKIEDRTAEAQKEKPDNEKPKPSKEKKAEPVKEGDKGKPEPKEPVPVPGLSGSPEGEKDRSTIPLPLDLWTELGLTEQQINRKFKHLREQRVANTDIMAEKFQIHNDGELALYFGFKFLRPSDINPVAYDEMLEFVNNPEGKSPQGTSPQKHE